MPTTLDDKVDEYTQSEKKNFLNKLQHLNKIFVHQNDKNLSSEETAKISYKHMQRIEISLYASKETTVASTTDCEKYFWFGAYDKHINTNNLLKVLQFYSDESANKIVSF